jgi:glycosyl hydrolase family 123/cellulose/xylan binding protein with CBM9 domain
MNSPAEKNIAYRDPEAGLPTRIWLPGATLKDAKSEYAGIKVKFKKSDPFPSAQLSKSPFYLIGLGRGKVEIEPTNGEDVAEQGKFILSCNEKGLVVDFHGEGKYKKSYIKKRKPWENDCIEIFIDPGKTNKRYFHFVIDSFGQRSQSECSLKKRNHNWQGKWESKISHTKNGWNCQIFIPFATLGAKLKLGDVWGLNLGRENSRTGRIGSWVILNNFHQVERFGNLILLNKNVDAGYELKIAKKIYSISEFQQKIKIMSLSLSKLPLSHIAQKEFLKLQKQHTDIVNAYNQGKSFYGVYEQCLALSNLKREYENFTSIQKRCAELFKPGGAESQKGFALLPESSMRKIKQFNYVPAKLTKIKLNLAGNEYGSFQLAIMADSVNNINKLEVSFDDLKGKDNSVIRAKNITSYLVEYIRTALPGQEQTQISDVLIPGNKFILKKARKTSGLWFDVYVPKRTVYGIYNGKIMVRVNDKKPEIINYQIEVYPFSLPTEISLKNVFCFVPKWAEQFYRKKMPFEKRKVYFDFILKHRLSPVNLWTRTPLLNEQELKYTRAKGANVITLPPNVLPEYVEMLKKNNYLDQTMFFASDEVQDRPHKMPAMKKLFAKLKQKYPEIPRLCTAWIDPRLYGSVDIWCPRFQQKSFAEKLEKERRAKGEKIWWYFTDGPGAPYANLNLNSSDIEPRIIPWMTWKVGAEGLLYWAINREWKTNGGEQVLLSDNDILTRSLNWLTPGCKQEISKGKRWPELPWIPLLISVATKRASATNGGGNLMYPGPDWQPYPSTRLKNLRDGLQDYEYLVILRDMLSNNKLPMQLREAIKQHIKIDKKVVVSSTKYTKNPLDILEEKKKLAALIIKVNKILGEK